MVPRPLMSALEAASGSHAIKNMHLGSSVLYITMPEVKHRLGGTWPLDVMDPNIRSWP